MNELRKKYRITPKFRSFAAWCAAVLFSLVFIFVGNKTVTKDLDIFSMEGAYAEKARVVSIGEKVTDSYSMSEDLQYDNSIQYFNAKILTGEFKGQEVLAAQTSDNYTISADADVSVGDKVMLYNYGTPEGEADWVFGGYYRLDGLSVFGLIFCALLLFFGHVKGLNTLISLAFTCLAVFMVFVPSVLSGFNVYFMSSITCVYVIIMTLLITSGATAKALTTILGCTFGVVTAALLELLCEEAFRLTGVIDEHSIYLGYLESGVTVDLRSLIFAMVTIGALGAVMDVAMDISASLHELHYRAPDLPFRELYKSGITIGRDVMGTMANTLVLAYIGSGLCSILLLITYSGSLRELLNRENMTVEILQALIGSTSILLTIPITSLVCGFLYTNREFLKLEGFAAKEAEAQARDAKVTRIEPPYKSIIPEEPAVLKKTDVLKPAKKQDASKFLGFYYERRRSKAKEQDEGAEGPGGKGDKSE